MKIMISIAAVFFTMSSYVSAQTPDRSRGQGYVFAAPGIGNYELGKPNIHIGIGGEGFIYRGLGIGAEIGGVGSDRVVGLGSANLSYHFFPRKTGDRLEPFVTAGYSLFFRAGLSGGYNAGGGFNLWLNKDLALRIEIRDQHSHRFETVSFRIGVTFR